MKRAPARSANARAAEPDEPDEPDDADKAVEAAEDPESTAILDGPPPDVPPPAPIAPPPDFALQAFDEAVTALKQLLTRPAAQFASTVHSADDLEKIESFIRAIRAVAGRLGQRCRRSALPQGAARNGSRPAAGSMARQRRRSGHKRSGAVISAAKRPTSLR